MIVLSSNEQRVLWHLELPCRIWAISEEKIRNGCFIQLESPIYLVRTMAMRDTRATLLPETMSMRGRVIPSIPNARPSSRP
jgi:hypothetical protein